MKKPHRDDDPAWAAERAHALYDGTLVPHRSCGVAIAETFGVAAGPYVGLRKGGLTGCATCGAVQAGTLVLGEKLTTDGAVGPAAPALVRAAGRYDSAWRDRLGVEPHDAALCRELTADFEDFASPARHAHCTRVASLVAESVAQALNEEGVTVTRAPMPMPLSDD